MLPQMREGSRVECAQGYVLRGLVRQATRAVADVLGNLPEHPRLINSIVRFGRSFLRCRNARRVVILGEKHCSFVLRHALLSLKSKLCGTCRYSRPPSEIGHSTEVSDNAFLGSVVPRTSRSGDAAYGG